MQMTAPRLRSQTFLIFIFLAAFPRLSQAFDVKLMTVYGQDNRQDWYEVRDPQWLRWADSSVALFDSQSLKATNTGYRVQGPTFQQDQKLCRDEKFADQIVSSFCSGALITDDLVLTAGHCIREKKDCDGTYFAFDYGIHAAGMMPLEISSSEVYRCREIVHTVAPPENVQGEAIMNPPVPDFALIRLDRKVPNHTPAEVDPAPALQKGDELLIIGYPSGLPLKFAGGYVRQVPKNYPEFDTNLDSFEGSSGSPVFSTRTGRIVGVMVDGDVDYVKYGSCQRARRCTDQGCLGQGITKMEEVAPFLPRR